MTRTRKATGHISFVGAGPGDPGLLTQRALEALASADHVVFDRGIPEPLLGTVRAGAHEEAQFSPAEGASGDVAKVLLSAARSGLHAVHLVAGDPFGHESVVREVQAVSRRSARRWLTGTSCPGGRTGRCTGGRCSSRGPRSGPAR